MGFLTHHSFGLFFAERHTVSAGPAELVYKLHCQVKNYKHHDQGFHSHSLDIIVLINTANFVSPLCLLCGRTAMRSLTLNQSIPNMCPSLDTKRFVSIFTSSDRKVSINGIVIINDETCISVSNALPQMLRKFFGKGNVTFLSFLMLLDIVKAHLNKPWFLPPSLTAERADGYDREGTLFSL